MTHFKFVPSNNASTFEFFFISDKSITSDACDFKSKKVI
ncbi:hypothetical protein VIAQ111709_08905 [Vibrio aquimaris]|uniref:Uncharacterized protein n=1 Tax=Vibrio aquimaris TaxID=2587862 RepID=A0A5P9CGD6_9VIBR|nr:hypothetical protein FIV01_02575 [Vibrio aquimaris]